MLLDFSHEVLSRELHVEGVLHVGAHLAEEAKAYQELGINRVVWIEGNEDLRERLRSAVEPLGHKLIIAVITDKDRNQATFHITNNDSMSSSVLEWGTHRSFAPEINWVDHRIVETRTIDSLMDEHGFGGINMLVMDLQGAELIALRGATRFLTQVDYIYAEVNTNYVYKDCALLPELEAFLPDFRRVAQAMTQHEWGDALYVRRRI